MRSILKVRGIDGLTTPELRALCGCADALLIDPDWLACVISFETGGSFDPAQRNHWADADARKRGVTYNGALGLIQFMPATALYLGTSIQELEKMRFVEQMAYVEKYLMTYATRIRSLEDCYLAVFYPNAIGRADDYVLGRRGASGFLGRVFEQNAGFDGKGGPKDGDITRGEVCSTIRAVRDAANGVRIDVPDEELPKAAPLLDMTELARDADDAARHDSLIPVTKPGSNS